MITFTEEFLNKNIFAVYMFTIRKRPLIKKLLFNNLSKVIPQIRTKRFGLWLFVDCYTSNSNEKVWSMVICWLLLISEKIPNQINLFRKRKNIGAASSIKIQSLVNDFKKVGPKNVLFQSCRHKIKNIGHILKIAQ